MFDKFFLKREAQRILRAVRNIDPKGSEQKDLYRWRRSTTSLVGGVFGSDDKLLKKLTFPGIEAQNLKAILCNVLEEFLTAVDTTDLPMAYRTPARRAWLDRIVGLVFGVFLTFLGFWLTGTNHERSADDYRRVEVVMKNWTEDYDSHLRPGYDSLVADFASRGVLQGGEAATSIVNYFREFRRKRDNGLDSLLVIYALAGGDTLDLSCPRKLDFDVAGTVKGLFRNLRVDLDQYRLDTL